MRELTLKDGKVYVLDVIDEGHGYDDEMLVFDDETRCHEVFATIYGERCLNGYIFDCLEYDEEASDYDDDYYDENEVDDSNANEDADIAALGEAITSGRAEFDKEMYKRMNEAWENAVSSMHKEDGFVFRVRHLMVD